MRVITYAANNFEGPARLPTYLHVKVRGSQGPPRRYFEIGAEEKRRRNVELVLNTYGYSQQQFHIDNHELLREGTGHYEVKKEDINMRPDRA